MIDRTQALEKFTNEIAKYDAELLYHRKEMLDPAWQEGAISGFRKVIELMALYNDEEMISALKKMDTESRITNNGIWAAADRGINYAANAALPWFRENNSPFMPNAVMATINNGQLHLQRIRIKVR